MIFQEEFMLIGSKENLKAFCDLLKIETDSDFSMNQVIAFNASEIEICAQTTIVFSTVNVFRLPSDLNKVLKFIKDTRDAWSIMW